MFSFKSRDKWNQLMFVPMPVLSARDQTSGVKTGKREGFHVFNRFSSWIIWIGNMIFDPQAVLQTLWEVLPHGIWFELPYLLLLLFSSFFSAYILQVVHHTKAKGEKSHSGVEKEQQGDKRGQKLSRRGR